MLGRNERRADLSHMMHNHCKSASIKTRSQKPLVEKPIDKVHNLKVQSIFSNAIKEKNVVTGFRQGRTGEPDGVSIVPQRFKTKVDEIEKELGRRPRVV